NFSFTCRFTTMDAAPDFSEFSEKTLHFGAGLQPANESSRARIIAARASPHSSGAPPMPRPAWVARATNAKRETLRSVFLSWRYSTGRRLGLKLHLQPGQQRYGQPKARRWCANGRTELWRCTTPRRMNGLYRVAAAHSEDISAWRQGAYASP